MPHECQPMCRCSFSSSGVCMCASVSVLVNVRVTVCVRAVLGLVLHLEVGHSLALVCRQVEGLLDDYAVTLIKTPHQLRSIAFLDHRRPLPAFKCSNPQHFRQPQPLIRSPATLPSLDFIMTWKVTVPTVTSSHLGMYRKLKEDATLNVG